MLSFIATSFILGYAYLLATTPKNDKKDIEAINDIFKEKKLSNFKDEYACVSGKKEYKHYTEYYVNIPLGKTTDDLEKCIPAIETYFKNNASVEYRKTDQEFIIKLKI